MVVREDISAGQRVRAFELQVKQGRKWRVIFSGSSIGNKLIIPLPENLRSSRFRLIISQSLGEPMLKEWGLY